MGRFCSGQVFEIFKRAKLTGNHFSNYTSCYKFSDFACRADLNFRGVKWTPIQHDAPHLRYLLIDMSYGMVDEPFEKRIEFWKGNPAA